MAQFDTEGFLSGFIQQQLSSQGFLGQTLEDQAQKRKNKLQLALESARTEQELMKKQRELDMEQQAKLLPQEQQQALVQQAATGQLSPTAPQPTTPLGQQRQFEVAQDIGKGKQAKALAGIKAKKEKAPAGYRWTEAGDLQIIPGGPVDLKQKQEQQKVVLRNKAGMEAANSILRGVDDALELTGFFTTGLTGRALTKLGFPSAVDLDSAVTQIKAGLAVDKLQQMRDLSKSGGAVGQVTEGEWELLASSVSSLRLGQSESQKRKNLNVIKDLYAKVKEDINNAAQLQLLNRVDNAEAAAATPQYDFAAEDARRAAIKGPGKR